MKSNVRYLAKLVVMILLGIMIGFYLKDVSADEKNLPVSSLAIGVNK